MLFSSVIIVGAIIALSNKRNRYFLINFFKISYGYFAILLAAINIFGGFWHSENVSNV